MEKAYKLEFENEQTGALVVNCCGCSKTEPLHSFGPALKPHYMIHYILSGKGVFRTGGREYPLEAGSGFLIVPGHLAFYQADEKEPWTYVWVGFSGSGVESFVSYTGLSVRHPVFQSDHSDELYGSVRDMMEHNTYGLTNELRRNGQLQIFLSLIAMSPQQFLTAFRLTRAAELLAVTQLPVESIALSCGYNDPLVFTKAFKQMKGMSPSAYRKELQKGETRRNREYLRQVEDFISQVKSLQG